MNELDDFLCEQQSDELLPDYYEALLNAVEDEYYTPDYI